MRGPPGFAALTVAVALLAVLWHVVVVVVGGGS